MLKEPVDIEDAEDGSLLALGGFPNPSLDECPITFLGYYDGRLVFAMPEGEIRDLSTRDISPLIKIDIFNTVEGQAFMTHWRDGDQKFARDVAVTWFIRQCREAGYWDRRRPQRSLGVWRGAEGGLILHRGTELWLYDVHGHFEKITIAEGMRDRSLTAIYRLRPPAPAPEPACPPEDGQWARRTLNLWRFEPIGDDGLTGADLVAGWLMAGLLGAVAPFRPHLLLYAMAGSGKTTLLRFVHALGSALAGDVIDSFTRAGLANDLAGMARPVLIDEAEATPAGLGRGPVEQALELIRRMATGDGAVRKMGDIGGGVVTQTAIGAVLMVAVNPVRLGPADASRIAEAKLLPLRQPPAPGEPEHKLATDAELDAATERAKALAPALLGRALANAERFREDAAQIKAALGRQGLDPRAADLVSALAAGRHLLVSDEPLDAETAEDEARFWAGLIEQRTETDTVANPGRDALMHLFNWKSGQHISDRVVSIGEVVRKAAGNTDVNGCNAVLTEFGLKVQHVKDEETGQSVPWLLVANRHPALETVFERTLWRDWRRSLGFIDAIGPEYKTRPANKAIRFGMMVQKALCVPLAPFLVTKNYKGVTPQTIEDD